MKSNIQSIQNLEILDYSKEPVEILNKEFFNFEVVIGNTCYNMLCEYENLIEAIETHIELKWRIDISYGQDGVKILEGSEFIKEIHSSSDFVFWFFEQAKETEINALFSVLMTDYKCYHLPTLSKKPIDLLKAA